MRTHLLQNSSHSPNYDLVTPAGTYCECQCEQTGLSQNLGIKFEEYSASSTTGFLLAFFLPLHQFQTCRVSGMAGFKGLLMLLGNYGTEEFHPDPAKMHVQHPAKMAGSQFG